MSVDIATLGIKVDASQVNKAEKDIDKLGAAGAKTEGILSKLGPALAGLGLAATAMQAIRLADAYSNIQGRLSLVSKGTDELAVVTERLYGVSQRTRQGFEATSDLYASLARSTKALNVNQSELLQVTETVSQALIVSGANAASSEAALRQLGQGFASGALRGDELNSVLENTPRLAQAIAEGMGVTIGQLREMGREGKLTGGAIFDALLSQQAIVEAEFARMPTTVGQAMTQLGNSFMVFVGQTNETLGVTKMLAEGIKFAADNVDMLIPVLGTLAAIMTVALIPSIGRMTAGVVLSTSATIAQAGAAIAAIPAQLAFAASFNGVSLSAAAGTTALAAFRAASMALLGLGIVAVLAAVAAAFVYVKTTALSAEEATSLLERSNRDYAGTLQTVIDYQTKYKMNTDATTAALDGALGITAQTNNMADAAAAAALRRAAAERQLTVDILRRRAAEDAESAAKLQKSAGLNALREDAMRVSAGAAMAAGVMSGAGANNAVARNEIRGMNEFGNQARTQYNQATGLYQRATSNYNLANEIEAAPLIAAPPTTRTGGATTADSGKAKADSMTEAERETKRATEAANDYIASLRIETSEIGKNAIQRQMANVELAASQAPTEALAEAIRAAGLAWQEATQNEASDELARRFKAANDELEFNTSLEGMNAREREIANAQRAITLALTEAEANGTPIATDAIKEQTDAILANAAARGQLKLDADNANEFADAMANVANRVNDAATGLRGLFGGAGDALAELASVYSDYAAHVADTLARVAEVEAQYGENSLEATKERAAASEELSRAQIDQYGNMLSAAKGFFEEGTTGYKVMQAAEQAYRLYQFAMAVQAMFFDTAETTSAVANAGVRMGVDAAETTSSVAKSGIRAAADGVAAFAKTLASLPFPFNLAAGAVVLAALVGVGVAMGGKGGGGKGSASTATAAIEEKPTSYTPFVSHDRNIAGANDNRIGAPAPSSFGGNQANSSKTNVFDFSGADFSGSDPAAVQQAVRDGIEQAKPDILADAREQSYEDLQQVNRQKLGG